VLSREPEGEEIFGSKTSAMIPLVRLLYWSLIGVWWILRKIRTVTYRSKTGIARKQIAQEKE
jgi:hypothetical protein